MSKGLLPTALPDDLERDLEHIQAIEQADQPTTVRKLLSKAVLDWKLDHYSNDYRTGKLSLAKAAEQANVTLWEMIDYVRAKKITPPYDRDDLEHDIKEIYSHLTRE
jgi:hypothetical protein